MAANKENLRVSSTYKNTSDAFLLQPGDLSPEYFEQQFFLIYLKRIQSLRDRLLDQASKIIGKNVQDVNFNKLKPNEKSLIIGVVRKKLKQRPSVLKEFQQSNVRSEEDAENEEATAFNSYDSMCSVSDEIELENVEQRLVLTGEIDKDDFVTGYVVAAYGVKGPNQSFVVEHVIFPELAPQVPWPIKVEETYVMFLSGIAFDNDLFRNSTTFFALSQFIDWLQGCGGSDEDTELARRVSRLVIAGDSVHVKAYDLYDMQVTKMNQRTSYDPTAISLLDKLLVDLVQALPVDLMPGPNDITSPIVPQQPMPVRMFDKCWGHDAEVFNMAPNPYSFELDGVRLLGTSGQNLHDLLKYTRGHSTLALMRQFFERSYLFPTYPDTIDGLPMSTKDPFVIDEIPHVYFVGNQSDHEFEMCEFANGAKTFLMTIPKFHEKQEVVLLNLKTMETQIFKFGESVKS